jgi:hypothetical protein
MDKIEFYFKVLARYDLYVQLANTKASNLITFLSSILVAITALVGWGVSFNNMDILDCLIIVLYMIFLFCCVEWYIHCMNVIQPNRKRSKVESALAEDDEDELSTIFYSDVAKFKDLQSIKNKVNAKDGQSHLDDLINQVYIMASVTEKKFDEYEKIQPWLISAVVLSLFILLLTCISKIN